MPVEEIKTKNLRWINVTDIHDISSPVVKYLKANFNFHPLNLKDCIIDGQRPKIDEYRDYFFMVLLYPIYNRKTREIESAEIDISVGKNFIITVHNNKLLPVVRLFNHLKKTKYKREKDEFLSNNVIVILHDILNKLICHCFPMLDHISMDTQEIEKEIFKDHEAEMVKEILMTRRNIVSFRKIMQAHKNILKKLEKSNQTIQLFDTEKARVYFNNLIEKTKEIWDTLEGSKESIEALYGTSESLISHRLNQIMKTFTSISVIIFALTLVATLFSINAAHTPFVRLPYAFWIILFIEFIVALLIFTYFKKRRWL